MNSLPLNSLTSLTYIFLYLSVVLLWWPSQRLIPNWLLAFALAVIAGIMSHQVTLAAVALIAAFGVAVYYSRPRSSSDKLARLIQAAACAGVVIIYFLLSAHLPIFHNLLVIDNVYLTPDAQPFTMYLNFDKAVIGILILGLSAQLINSWRDWQRLFKKMFFGLLLIVSIFIALALTSGFAKFDFKIPECIVIWSLTNLLFTCVAEEAFFRQFLQGHLTSVFQNIKNGEYLAIVIAAVLFGATHYAGGMTYMLFATAAGFGFGLMLKVTRRIEAAIITHFVMNLVHILFFTYPALAVG